MGHLLYLMFRCDFDVMESLEEWKGTKHSPYRKLSPVVYAGGIRAERRDWCQDDVTLMCMYLTNIQSTMLRAWPPIICHPGQTCSKQDDLWSHWLLLFTVRELVILELILQRQCAYYVVLMVLGSDSGRISSRIFRFVFVGLWRFV